MADHVLVKYSGDWIFYQGAAAAGALLYVYDSGTTDLASIFTDKDLLVASANPVTADSGGLMPFAYRGTSAYKVVIKTSSGTTIDTEDAISGALDTSTFTAATFAKSDADVAAKTIDYTMVSGDLGTVLNVNPTSATVTITLMSAVTATNGRGITIRHTGTANQVNIATVSAQTIDGLTTKTLLGEYESIEIVSDGANWHIKGDANRTVVGGSISPQGYLTLLSTASDALNYFPSSDVSAASAVYYRPTEIGNLIPLYDGTRFVLYEFSELTLTLVSQHSASAIYDVFVFLNSNTVTIGTGPAWSTATAGSCARGTGGVTTELTRVKGLPLNANAITARNSSTTYSLSASRATYVGSIFMDGTNGQITCHTSYGQSRKWGVWNAHNRRPITLKAGDSTASWSYATNTIRQSNGAAGNTLALFSGLADEPYDLQFLQNATGGGSNSAVTNGLGLNVTNAYSGFSGKMYAASSSAVIWANAVARYLSPPLLGLNNINALERADNSTATTFLGGEDDCLMTARWRG